MPGILARSGNKPGGPKVSLQEEIKRAIGAHGLWKGRLITAIESGKSDLKPEVVCLDNQCDFGRWLHGSAVDPVAKRSPEYLSCRDLHAEFHKAAADVLKLAVTGQKAKAHDALASNGKFVTVSTDLTRAMMHWSKVATP